MPLLLNLVPALRHDNRDISVKFEGKPVFIGLIGEDDIGIVIVSTNPRIAEVRILEASRASLSRSTS